MAQQGLFTQGPSVTDLLQQRNQRGADLQQHLMQQAAQGARDPMKAQAASLIGSSLGRALAGSMGGGQDKQVEAIEAKNAQQQGLQQEALAVSSGTIAEKRAFIDKIAPIYPEYAQELTDKVNLQAVAKDKELKDNLALSVENEELQARSESIGKSLVESSPNLAKLLMNGNSTEKLYEEGIKALGGTEGASGNANIESAAAFKVRRVELDKLLAAGDITQSQHTLRMSRASSMFGGGVDPRIGQQAKQNALGLQKVLDESQAGVKGINARIGKYNQSLAILDTGVFVGTGADVVQSVRSMAVAMGVADEDTEINEANFARFQSLSVDAAMDYIEQTKGAVSDKEMTLYAKAAQGTDKSPEANRIILKTAKKIALWTKSKDLALNTWVSQNQDSFPSSANLKVFEAKWEKANELDLTDAITQLSSIDKGAAKTTSELEAMSDDEVLDSTATINAMTPDEVSTALPF
jgi:uncharacterized protein YaeQ